MFLHTFVASVGDGAHFCGTREVPGDSSCASLFGLYTGFEGLIDPFPCEKGSALVRVVPFRDRRLVTWEGRGLEPQRPR
jgi:hypothetical protein